MLFEIFFLLFTLFSLVSDTPDPVGNGGTSDTGETFDKLLGPEFRESILKLIKVQWAKSNSLLKLSRFWAIDLYRFAYLAIFALYKPKLVFSTLLSLFQKKTPTQTKRIRKIMQFMYVTASVVNCGQEIEVEEFEEYLKTGMIER